VAEKTVAVVVGSLRRASFSRRTAQALIRLAPETLRAEIIEIGELALYNEDLEREGPPPAWISFRDAIRPCDGVLYVTPE
jgi:chromate reductase